MYPHVNLVPFNLETTGRPGFHAKKFISNCTKDADNPPPPSPSLPPFPSLPLPPPPPPSPSSLPPTPPTHSHLPSETPGQPSRASSTMPSPNSSHVTLCPVFPCLPRPQFRIPTAFRSWMQVPSMREHPLCLYLSAPKCNRLVPPMREHLLLFCRLPTSPPMRES